MIKRFGCEQIGAWWTFANFDFTLATFDTKDFDEKIYNFHRRKSAQIFTSNHLMWLKVKFSAVCLFTETSHHTSHRVRNRNAKGKRDEKKNCRTSLAIGEAYIIVSCRLCNTVKENIIICCEDACATFTRYVKFHGKRNIRYLHAKMKSE